MGLEILDVMFRGICVGVAASITVGPVAVLCIQRTLSKSRRSGIVSGLGVACADTFMAMAALFFYSMLQTQIEQYNTLLRVIGGIFVVIVVAGLRLDLRADDRQFHHGDPLHPRLLRGIQDFGRRHHARRRGRLLPRHVHHRRILRRRRGLVDDLAFVINLFRRRFRPRHMLTINHVAGLIIGILGIYTILSTFFDIFPNVG